MKRLRKHPHFLLFIALALPVGLAFLHYDLLTDRDLVLHRQISTADKSDSPNLQRAELRTSVAVVLSAQPLYIARGVNPFFSNDLNPAVPSQSYSILRC